MMDTISYSQNEKGELVRVVVHTEVVENPKEEARVIAAQLTDIVAGGGDIDDAIANYKQALSDLATVKSDQAAAQAAQAAALK